MLVEDDSLGNNGTWAWDGVMGYNLQRHKTDAETGGRGNEGCQIPDSGVRTPFMTFIVHIAEASMNVSMQGC